MAKKKTKQLIGRRERVDFPELDLYGITAKIDTGAYSTALHCHDIYIREVNGEQILCFKLLDPGHPDYNEREHRFKNFGVKRVRSSFGTLEKRFVIKTKVCLAGQTINSIISLSDRANMRYPVLIGRKLLQKRFIIDVSKVDTWPEKHAG